MMAKALVCGDIFFMSFNVMAILESFFHYTRKIEVLKSNTGNFYLFCGYQIYRFYWLEFFYCFHKIGYGNIIPAVSLNSKTIVFLCNLNKPDIFKRNKHRQVV